jgi:hypothetical protein
MPTYVIRNPTTGARYSVTTDVSLTPGDECVLLFNARDPNTPIFGGKLASSGTVKVVNTLPARYVEGLTFAEGDTACIVYLDDDPNNPVAIQNVDVTKTAMITSGSGKYLAYLGKDGTLEVDDPVSLVFVNDDPNSAVVITPGALAIISELYAGTWLGRLYKWADGDKWVQKAERIEIGTWVEITQLLVFNGEIYAGVAGDGNSWWKPYLLKWNGVDAWIKLVDFNWGSQAIGIGSLVEYNGSIYAGAWGGFSPGGALFMYDGHNYWIDKAPMYVSEQAIFALIVFNGKLYGGSSFNGYLLEWNDSNAWVLKAGAVSGANTIRSMVNFNGELYAGTGPYSKLLKWNGSNAWVELAGQYGSESYLKKLIVYRGALFACTGLSYTTGCLLEWSGTAWIHRATLSVGATDGIMDLAVFNDSLYGISASGKLYRWNNVDAWVEVADTLNYDGGMCLAVFPSADS